ncbi:hypothetical protein ABZ135_38355 [Streptomyces sp. NPDC006339]|uniref:hypothetical protein n=1 Tax=Streptomyces sp. NPDC006339 TaxID=3156755 RepID=UPI0033A62F65
MTPDETVILARYVRALCPQQKFDEYTPDAWHDVLSDFTLDEARTAAAAVARQQAFVAPGEIATEVRKNRRALVSVDAETEPPTADPNNVPLYLRQVRTHRRNVATGRTPAVPALPAAITEADITAMRQQEDLKAFRQQITKEAVARCAARVQIIGRHPDLVERVTKLLGRDNWNGFISPEYDASGRRNDSPNRTGLLAILAEAEQRTNATRSAA